MCAGEQMTNRITLTAIIIVVVVVAIAVVLTQLQQNKGSLMAQPANVQIVDHNLAQTGGVVFTLHYVASGTVVNNGGSASNPVVILITIKDPNSNILFTTTTTSDPSILQPQQQGTYTKQFTTDDLGSYHGAFTSYTSIEQQ
jgi:hypothetical protein